ncbi:MAG: peptidyl-prolyl cis-trans isomerase [Proteobacteria bacterium]|nr:peptidyl-prolyl cis-trans isomerase [Pseudomonadota bacterium]
MRPLARFAAIGGTTFALAAGLSLTGPSVPNERTVHLSAERLASVGNRAARALGRPPLPAELEAFVQAEIDDEVLLREALARGLAETDPVVRRRLRQNWIALGNDPTAEDTRVWAAAKALGMLESDPVVRRRLALRMRHELEAPGRRSQPPPEALARPEPSEPRVRFRQILFSRTRRGQAALPDARRAAAALAAGDPEAAHPGDPPRFDLGEGPLAAADIGRYLGPEFAQAVLAAPPGTWFGPILSPHGAHLVRVEERVLVEKRALPELGAGAAAADAEVLAWQDREGRRGARAALDDLRARYRITRSEAPSPAP